MYYNAEGATQMASSRQAYANACYALRGYLTLQYSVHMYYAVVVQTRARSTFALKDDKGPPRSIGVPHENRVITLRWATLGCDQWDIALLIEKP